MKQSAEPGGYGLVDVAPRSAEAKLVGLERQLLAADLVTRGDGAERGVRSVLLANEEISLEVVVDRGMDIAGARVRQLPVAWLSPTGIVGPWYAEHRDFGPHRTFFGGLLTTCGLDHVGRPATRSAARFDYPSRQSESLPLHGRVGNLPARLRAYGIEDVDGVPTAFAEGMIQQTAVFGEHLVLIRRIELPLRSRTLVVTDIVENQGYATSPLAVLYHVNVGWPILAPGARVAVDREQDGDDTWRTVGQPRLDREGAGIERAWWHQVRPDGAGRASASITNSRVDDKRSAGLRIEWDAAAMPTMLQWHIDRPNHYAMGLEPVTSAFVTPGAQRAFEFPTIEPGEKRLLGMSFEFLLEDTA